MNTGTAIAVVGLAATIVASIWPIIQWRKSRDADRVEKKVNDDAEVREDMRKWNERLSNMNAELLRRLDALEKDRETDRQKIEKLERRLTLSLDYIHKLTTANPDMRIPPAPAELGI